MTLKNRLMTGGAYASGYGIMGKGIAFAPPGEEGQGGGTGGTGGNQESGGNDHSNIPLFGALPGGDDEGDDDGDSIFDAFGVDDTAEDGPDDTTASESVFTDISPEEVTALKTDVESTIAGMQFPDAMIPADFDPNDRTQFKQVMDNAMRAAVAHSMAVTFKPMQAALKQVVANMTQQMDSKLKDSQTSGSARQILESMVPEVNDPKYAATVKALDETLRGKGKKPTERAKAIRKMLNQMGVKSEGGGRQQQGGGATQQKKTMHQGSPALDNFFGAFKRPS